MLLDLMIGGIIALLVGAAACVLLQSNYKARDAITGQNNVNAIARDQMDSLADSLRNAQVGPFHKTLASAGTSDVTLYTNSTGDAERYWMDTTVTPAQLKRSKTVSGVTTISTLNTGISALVFTYYKSGGFTTTTNPHVPTSAELSTVSAVSISTTLSINGFSDSVTSLVRLRNSP
jgi:hypothetical protein